MQNVILILIGFAILTKSADWFVEGASTIAVKLKIPKIIVGLTIVSIGTSAPELSVSISSALKGNVDLIPGNIIGSNIFNLLIVVGIAALVKPITINKSILRKDIPVMIASSITLLILLYLNLGKSDVMQVSKVEGLIFIILTILYIICLVKQAKQINSEIEFSDTKVSTKQFITDLIKGIIGLILVIKSGDMIVNNSVLVAKQLGMSDTLVGLTIIAIGTSLPELATSVTSALKGESGLAVGNAVGSNIFNILLILGTTSLVTPVTWNSQVLHDTIIYTISSIVIYIALTKTKSINRLFASIMVISYISYLTFTIIRG